ncbi:peptide-methionine (S)-S-oxide reductase MsrA [Candidatus Beckwithbacteria bacterium]|nr:peptide-methionine (S)-S-oxide reductase MsrA [Candidatus Beckwithbacteria bacterium]
MAKTELAVFGAGCFWCSEATFKMVPGIIKVTPGYAGGNIAEPSYDLVSTGTTGHTEVVELEYDPTKISYQQLLDIFWKIHDPTTFNRQGNDIGPQYRSIILWTNQRQKELAEAAKKEQASHFTMPIVTEIKPLEIFYGAEAEHHNYFEKHPDQAYCKAVIVPKIVKLQKFLDQ